MRLKLSIAGALIGLALLLLPAASALAADPAVDAVAQELICQCGCTMIVKDCTCTTADQTRTLIRQKLDQGQSKDQILQYFVSQYGEKTLAAPSKSGFNLTAWILPFVGIVVAGGIIYFVISRWVIKGRRQEESEASMAQPGETADQEYLDYQERLKKELEQFS